LRRIAERGEGGGQNEKRDFNKSKIIKEKIKRMGKISRLSMKDSTCVRAAQHE